MAILHGPIEATGVRIERGSTVEKMCAVFTRSHRLAGTGPISVSELAGEDFVLFDRDQCACILSTPSSRCACERGSVPASGIPHAIRRRWSGWSAWVWA